MVDFCLRSFWRGVEGDSDDDKVFFWFFLVLRPIDSQGQLEHND